MNLENYFPVLLFILVGIAVGIVPQILGRILAPSSQIVKKHLPMNVALRPSKMRA